MKYATYIVIAMKFAMAIVIHINNALCFLCVHVARFYPDSVRICLDGHFLLATITPVPGRGHPGAIERANRKAMRVPGLRAYPRRPTPHGLALLWRYAMITRGSLTLAVQAQLDVDSYVNLMREDGHLHG